MRTLPTTMIRVLDPFSPLFSNASGLMSRCFWRCNPRPRQENRSLRPAGFGPGRERRFCRYHRVLSRASWSSRGEPHLARAACGGVRPRGTARPRRRRDAERLKKIAAKGIYRDPVRSSHEHFVKTSGLRWVPDAFSSHPVGFRVWALPFLSALAYSERYAKEHGKRHKPLTEWAWQLLLQVRRWHPSVRSWSPIVPTLP